MSRTLHQIPTEIYRVRIAWQPRVGSERTEDFGPYLSIGTAKACVSREMSDYIKNGCNGQAEIFRYSLPGEWEVVK